MTTGTSGFSAASLIRSSSVARYTPVISGQRMALVYTCQNMGLPWIMARGLPGNRLLSNLAGMIP